MMYFLGAMSVGILSKNILVWDVIYISIGNFRCSIMKVCGNFCMSMASADKCFLIPPRITRSISSNERLSFKKIHASWACRGCALKNFCEFLAKKFVNSKKVRTFATLSAGKGRLAQLVQSVCLTSRGSGVRIPQRPPIKKSIPAVAKNPCKGRLAQLVQSICLTSRGSGVRIPQRPPRLPLKWKLFLYPCISFFLENT